MKKITISKSTWLLFIAFLTYMSLQAQVFDGNMWLVNQDQVNDFNYTEVTGFLDINGSCTICGCEEITDLTPLSKLTTVGGSLYIAYHPALTSLDGLQNLTSVGGVLAIQLNPALTSLGGLQNLTSVGEISFMINPALTSLDGLQSLTSIGGDLWIDNHSALTSLDGLQNLTSIGGDLSVWSVPTLTSLDGLQNLTSIGTDFYLIDNEALTNLDGLQNLTSVGSNLNIQVNNLLTNFCGLYPLIEGGGLTGIFNVYSNAENPTEQDIIADGPCINCTSYLNVSITAFPSNNIFTGGVPTTIYLGYGPQSVTLESTVTGGSGFTYSWTSTTLGLAGLSCTTCANPVFTPTEEGKYIFSLTVTNSDGCSTTSEITICVLDIQVPRSNNKVYLCHLPPGNPGNRQTLSISVNAVPAHITNHSGDFLGKCDQSCDTIGFKNLESTGELIISSDKLFSTIVYPNPFTSDFTIAVETESMEPIRMNIYDLTGRLMQEVKDIMPNTPIVVANDFTTGFYLLHIHQGNHDQKVKIIKNK